jgi:hypothetical protein
MENKDTLTGLRADCLGFTGVTSMAIALISPTMTAALIIPLMYSNAARRRKSLASRDCHR